MNNSGHDFDNLYREEYSRIVRFIRTLETNWEEAEDLAQETFVKAFRAYEGCHDVDHLQAWLRQIAYRTFVDRRRSARKRVLEINCLGPDSETSIDSHADTRPSPEELVCDGGSNERLTTILWALDRQSRSLMELAYVHDLTNNDIARKLKIKPHAVRSRKHRVMKKLKGKFTR